MCKNNFILAVFTIVLLFAVFPGATTVYAGTHTFNGDVFYDLNNNGIKDTGENWYANGTMRITVSTSGATANAQTNSSGAYSVTMSGTMTGNFCVQVASPPSGYVVRRPASGQVCQFDSNPNGTQVFGGADFTLGPAFTPTPTAPPPPPTPTSAPVTSGSITNLNFGISNLYPWIQVNCGSVRLDNGVSSRIPQTAVNRNFVTTNSTCGSPGVIITGNSPSSFGNGQASNNNWVVGGALFPEEYVARGSANMTTSYDNMYGKAQLSATPPTNLATVCNVTNCALPVSLPSGVYTAAGDVNLQDYTVQSGRDYIFLIRGNLTLNGSFLVPTGSDSSAVFSVRGNITVDETVGTAATSTQNSLEGIYSTDSSFIVSSTGNCPDERLNIGGAVIVNAGLSGGTLRNDRDLCGFDTQYPTIYITQRLDMALNAAPFISRRTTTSNEAAP